MESGEAAADRGLADASVAVAGEQRQWSAVGMACALVVPGGEEAAEFGRDGEHAAVGPGQDGAVAGEAAEVRMADVVGAAAAWPFVSNGADLYV